MLDNNKILSKRIIFQDEHTIKLFSPAKVNLTLKIMGRLKSGYHLIQSIICPISLTDCLTLEVDRKGTEISCEVSLSPYLQSHLEALGNKDQELAMPYLTLNSRENLVIRALEKILQAAGLFGKLGLSVKIEKDIPLGAGLGGGSSNAASAVLALAELVKLDLKGQNIREILSEIGTDIPVFLNDELSLVTGVGEKITPLTGDGVANIASLKALLVKPLAMVNTKKAYAFFGLEPQLDSFKEELHGVSSNGVKQLLSHLNLQPKISDNSNNLLTLLEQKGICDMHFSETQSKLLGNFFNDFQIPVFQRYLEIKNCFENLVSSGAKKVLLTGSGSSLIAFFVSEELRENVISEFSKNSALFCRRISLEP